jgi:3'-phosphoadenosine 5'-phosphosulfate sulfotransferase (PAPS reductase)/FAD synthetase
MVRLLSIGAGVKSTVLLVLNAQGKVDFDLAIYMDNGDEHPETYDYIEQVPKPFCQKHK